MNNAIRKKIDKLLVVRVWGYHGMPSEIISGLDALLAEYSISELVSELESLLPDYRSAAKVKGSSGMAAELQMITGVRLIYLEESLKYIRSFL
ncbi:hypothetical protein [Flocculibacter collagenilyticus]|uniref:hypothetical protein n=1 Tax=Flocculibacter collagenilyticus TaxID=2744479 RepID=UPI0018F64C6F|nr:hypothetical protein [Flocculibacter collagenilyticus]